MATIRPFNALRPPKNTAAAVAAVPYDVVNTEEACELAADNPLSFLHVSRAEIDLDEDTDPYSDAVYEKAAQNFDELKLRAPLTVDPSPGLYIYTMQMDDHTQTGIAACCSIDEYDSDFIRKHERTRKDKEDDRTRHMLTIGAQTGPVLMSYRGRGEIDRRASDEQTAEPISDFTAPGGVRHTLWRVSDEAQVKLVESFRAVELLYIADGHHRAASASRARSQRRNENPDHTGNEEYNFFLSVLFPSDQLRILAYNRVVRDLNGMWADEFINALSEKFDVVETVNTAPTHKGELCVYVSGKWYSLTLPPGTTAPIDPISGLDVSIVQDRLLSPILGIEDVRTDKRIDFVGGIRGTEELERVVNEGHAAAAFSLHPVAVDELIAIADAGQIMPPKSTWFEPKLRDGLLSHLI